MPRRSLTAKQRASSAQAKLLAAMWGRGQSRPVGGYIDPTVRACVERGWIVPNGEVGKYPNGETYQSHVVSGAGLLALESFLMEARLKGSFA